MITIYHLRDSASHETIHAAVTEHSLAHRIVRVARPSEADVRCEQLPALKDGEAFVQGRGAVLEYIEKLGRLKEEWDRFQGDSCYCGDDGEVL